MFIYIFTVSLSKVFLLQIQRVNDGLITKTDRSQGNTTESDDTPSKKKGSSSHYLWAILIARIYAVFPLVCPDCGGQMKIIAFIREKPIIHKILNHIGEPTEPPALTPARAPPPWDEYLTNSSSEFTLPDVIPDYCYAPLFGYEFDQTISW